MLRFVGLRMLGAVPLLLASSFIVFAFVHLSPGSPERLLTGGHQVDPATLRAIRAHYHLDQPFLVQYFDWLKGVMRGDLGLSITFNDAVSHVLVPRILPTVELAVYALVLILGIGVPLGVVAALRRGSVVDGAASGFVLIGATLSPYVLGILLIALLAVGLGWFPVFGLGGAGLDRIYHLTLPAAALAIALLAYVARTTRASLVDVLDQEYVEAARSRGFAEPRVVGRHALRNALIPVVTITGLVFGWLLSGSVLVEYTFGLNGLGALLVQSVVAKDFAVVQAVALIFAVAFIVTNLLVDIVYALIDPRVRLASRGA